MESFVGIEQASSHTVMAGWQKGSTLVGHDLTFVLNSTGFPASELYYTTYRAQLIIIFTQTKTSIH